MKITIDLVTGPNQDDNITKKDMTQNIESLRRYLNNSPVTSDANYLIDSMSILEAIRDQMEE